MTASRFVSRSTPELRQGDIVRAHGMRVLIDGIPTDSGSRPGTFWYRGLILNIEETRAADLIPNSWIEDGRWTIQGNELALWSVEADSA